MDLATPALQALVDGLAQVAPGAAVGLLHPGLDEPEVAVAGVVTPRGEAVAPSTSFQAGSITKVHVATLLALAAEDGLLGLHDPVSSVLPELRIAGAPAPDSLTVLGTLTHRVGFDDLDPSAFGEGEGAVSRLVEGLEGAEWLCPPGTAPSYSNTGFALAGRLLEVVHGMPFGKVLQQRLLTPAGLEGHAVDARTAPGLHLAVPHVIGADGWALADPVTLPDAFEPAGSLLCLTAADLCRFGALHLPGGWLPEGVRAPMQQAWTQMPDRDVGTGLAWGIDRTRGTTVLRHDGGTAGSSSRLLVLPDRGVVVAILANGAMAHPAFTRVEDTIATWLGLPARPRPAPAGRAPEGVAGVYRRSGSTVVITEDDDGLAIASPLLPAPVPLVPVGGRRLEADLPLLGPLVLAHTPADDIRGVPEHVHVMGRLHVRGPGQGQRE